MCVSTCGKLAAESTNRSHLHMRLSTGYGGICGDVIEALRFLVNPDFLLKYKKYMITIGLPLTEKDLFEVDLINNERYHPFERLKVLKKLCFSSQFGMSLVQRSVASGQANNTEYK